jgi:hypothetical protein
MDTAVPLAVNIAGVLSLASMAAFVTASVHLIRDRSDAPGHTATSARPESAERSTGTVGDSFLSA